MKPIQALYLSLLPFALAAQIAHAGDQVREETVKLGEHPAVLVARKAARPDPTASFYLHPARLSWTLQRPLSDGEHPAVLVARHESKIDPNRFILGHPAGGGPAESDTAGKSAGH
jgi:hypothetical protein